MFTLKQAKKAEVEQKYSSTLSLISALEGSGWQTPRPAVLTPGKRQGTHFTVGWVGPKAGLDGCGKPCPHRDAIPGPSSP